MIKLRLMPLATAVAALLCLSAVVAAASEDPTEKWTLRITSDGDSHSIEVIFDDPEGVGTWKGEPLTKSWGDPDDDSKWIPLDGSGAMLQTLDLSVLGEPVVSLGFAATAGTADTTFLISVMMPIPAILGEGTATAQVGASDLNQNGATVTGLYSTKCYRASYNGGTVFADLVSGFNVPPYGSHSESETKPPWQPMGMVSSMQASFYFTLSARDMASGTSSFTVRLVPEPGSMVAMLAGVVGLAGFALRRRKA